MLARIHGIATATLLAVAALTALAVLAGNVTHFNALGFGLLEDPPDHVRWFHLREHSLYWIALIAFWTWVWAAYRRLRAEDVELRYSPVKALAAFVVPVLNLWAPLPVMRDLWRAAERYRLAPVPWQAMPSPVVVIACWATLVIGLFIWAFETLLDAARRGSDDLVTSIQLHRLERYTWAAEDAIASLGSALGMAIVLHVLVSRRRAGSAELN